MRVNRFMLIAGLVFALAGGGAIFVINSLMAPTPSLVVAARRDIPAGTRLTDIPEDQLVLVPLQLKAAGRPLLQSLMSPQDLENLRASGGILIQDVLQYEPLLLRAVVAADNPAAARLARLGMDDPDRMLVVIAAQGTAPESIAAGDRVDLAVAVQQVRNPIVLEAEEQYPAPPSAAAFLSPVDASPEELLEALAAEAGIELTPARPTAEPTPTPLPEIREPLAKVLVHAAPVVRVIRERTVSSFTSTGEAQVEPGPVAALEVIIPRAAFEMVTMASSAGILQIGVLSPLAGEEASGPTLGASLQDLLDLFYADRETLSGIETPAAHAQADAAPTATPTPAKP